MNCIVDIRPRGLRLLAVAIGFGTILAASPSAAELLAYDPFLTGDNPAAGEYDIGPLADQNPTVPYGSQPGYFDGAWIANGTSTGGTVQSGSLSYVGFPSPGGSATSVLDFENGITGSRTGRYFTDEWDDSTNATYYMSVVANFESGVMGYRAMEFWRPGVDLSASGIDLFRNLEIGYSQYGFFGFGAQQDPATARLAITSRAPSLQTTILTSTPLSFDEDGITHLIVFKFELSDQPGMDQISVFLDPISPAEPGFANAVQSGKDFSLAAISTLSFFGDGISPGLDDLRIGTTFADVFPPFPPIIPEPSSRILALAAAVVVSGRMRRLR